MMKYEYQPSLFRAIDSSLPPPPPPSPAPPPPPSDDALAAAGCVRGWSVQPDVLYTYSRAGCALGQAAVPWVPINPCGVPGSCEERGGACPVPLARHASPVRVTVAPGEVLFLPALWYHQVAHERTSGDDDVTIAVNAWFNMRFDTPGHVAYQLARAVAPFVQQQQQQQQQQQPERGDGDEYNGGASNGAPARGALAAAAAGGAR